MFVTFLVFKYKHLLQTNTMIVENSHLLTPQNILDHPMQDGQGCGNTMSTCPTSGPSSFRTSKKFQFSCPGTSIIKYSVFHALFL